MTPQAIAAFALEQPEVREEQPFGPHLDVYKVAGKIFALVAAEEEPPTVSLKCEPSLAIELRHQFSGVTPGYHLNKKHWNTVRLDGSVPSEEVEEMLDHSYRQVVAGLPASTRRRIHLVIQ